MKNQKGFSLVELLVVIIIIAIIAAIAIPNLLASRRAANEASAINSLRTIHSAQATYFATSGGGVNYGTLTQLGPGTGNAGLIDAALAGTTKSGYTFGVVNSTPGQFCATGIPGTGTGDRAFAVGTPGVIHALPGAVAPTCVATTGVISNGSPIQ